METPGKQFLIPKNRSIGKIDDFAIPFDEYKMYYESTERVTDRRLGLNRTNASLCLVIAAGNGIALGWSFDKQDALPFALVVATVISLLAILFCLWWFNQLVSYKDLNDAKFKVLGDMAPRVVFSGAPSGARSFLPFEREWRKMEEMKGLQKYKRTLALRASFSELTVPISFIVFYVLTIVFCDVIFINRGYYKPILSLLI